MKNNPFRFGAPVDGEFYFPRPHLLKQCEGLLVNAIPLALVGARRHGKTSFARQMCLEWQKKGYGNAVLLDVYNVSSHQDFLLQLLFALQSHKKLWQKICGWVKSLADHLTPDSLTLEREAFGKLTLEWLSEQDEQQKKLRIKETLSSLSESSDGRFCLIIDECQQLSKELLEDEGWLEATLREYIQLQAGKVSYMLTGSRRDIIHAMVNDERRPLYRMLNIIDFPPLEPAFTDWVLERFEKIGIKADKEAIIYLRKEVNDSPNYVQMVCYHLVAMGFQHVTHDAVDTALANIVPQNAYSYETHLHNLSPVQQRVLRMVALEEEGYFSESMLKRYEISTTAHVTNATNALKKKNILDQEMTGRGRVAFDDPLFRLWLRYKFGGYIPGQSSKERVND